MDIHLNLKFILNSPKDALKVAEDRKLGQCESGAWKARKPTIEHLELICVPRMNVKHVCGSISHVRLL